MYFLGIDIGTSSVKLSILDGHSGKLVGATRHPEKEYSINTPKQGWAEQHPDMWWQSVVDGMQALTSKHPEAKKKIASIGISYQMHGLVAVNKNQEPVYPSIIWCDSRAIGIGKEVYDHMGHKWCMDNLLNAPGNFTFSKLLWLADNKPKIFAQIDKIMLPGDYIAMKLTGEVTSTANGLSEGILWNFKEKRVAKELFIKNNIDVALLPSIKSGFGVSGHISEHVAKTLGLASNVSISYRAGDQPNNAFSLNVLEPGEFATTAGTSGVIYAVTDKNIADKNQRINSFLHVNHLAEKQTLGLLACINGAGRLNSWLKQMLSATGNEVSYSAINEFAAKAPIGSLGVCVHPFGNGSERILNNKLLSAQFLGLDFNRHSLPHLCRAVHEGVAFSMALGMKLICRMGINNSIIRAGKTNMFLSDIFSQAFVNTTQTPLELYDTDGAEGAARGAAWGSNFYKNRDEAFSSLEKIQVLEPMPAKVSQYTDVYSQWFDDFEKLNKS